MRTSLICLPLLALIAPLAAQEINAPEPRWPVVMSALAAADSGTTDTAEKHQAEPGDAEHTQSEGSSAPTSTPGALSAPITESGTAAEARTPAPESHKTFRACAPRLTVVNPGEDQSPLTVRQKFRVFYRYTYDPCRYAGAAAVAGIRQAENDPEEYGQGAEGYGKRVGANLADTNMATFFARFLLPTLLHDDPRYFRIGTSGTTKQRVVHAVLSPEWTRRDNGTQRFNYSRVLGDLIAASIGNAYRPDDDRGAGDTFRRTGTMLGVASASALFVEFWPDIKARIFKKHTSEPETKK